MRVLLLPLQRLGKQLEIERKKEVLLMLKIHHSVQLFGLSYQKCLSILISMDPSKSSGFPIVQPLESACSLLFSFVFVKYLMLRLPLVNLDYYALRIGTLSDVLGILSSTTNRNTEKDKRTVIPSETFSPDSGGTQNINRSMMESRMIGIKTFMMVYSTFLSNTIEN